MNERKCSGVTGRKEKEERGEVRKTGRGLIPPTIESMREPRMSRSEAPEMGGIGDTSPWNQGNPH